MVTSHNTLLPFLCTSRACDGTQKAEAGVASCGAPEDPAASESVSLSQLDELKTMREEVTVLAGSTRLEQRVHDCFCVGTGILSLVCGWLCYFSLFCPPALPLPTFSLDACVSVFRCAAYERPAPLHSSGLFAKITGIVPWLSHACLSKADVGRAVPTTVYGSDTCVEQSTGP